MPISAGNVAFLWKVPKTRFQEVLYDFRNNLPIEQFRKEDLPTRTEYTRLKLAPCSIRWSL